MFCIFSKINTVRFMNFVRYFIITLYIKYSATTKNGEKSTKTSTEVPILRFGGSKQDIRTVNIFTRAVGPQPRVE
jgi:hypothetical protein